MVGVFGFQKKLILVGKVKTQMPVVTEHGYSYFSDALYRHSHPDHKDNAKKVPMTVCTCIHELLAAL